MAHSTPGSGRLVEAARIELASEAASRKNSTSVVPVLNLTCPTPVGPDSDRPVAVFESPRRPRRPPGASQRTLRRTPLLLTQSGPAPGINPRLTTLLTQRKPVRDWRL